ncbi:MAG: OmpA family protein [Nitrospirota bacterium]|jgi:outer membrane protein OmpA-like peptidoglycan-associated protein
MTTFCSFLGLVVLTITIASGDVHATSAAPEAAPVYALVAVTPGFDMGRPGRVAAADYNIAGNDLDRLAVGDRLWVVRERRLAVPAFATGTTLQIPVATVRVIQVDDDTAVTRLEAPLPRQRHPHIAYAAPMVGDRLVPDPPSGVDTVVVLPSDVLFDFDRFDLRGDARPTLDALARTLTACPTGAIEVHGHTDALGPPEYNRRLSVARAQAVAEYLATTAHLPRGRFHVVGHGESQPAADNDTLRGRQQNRRVTVRLPMVP